MVKKVFAQLERLAFGAQLRKIKRNYPNLEGIKAGAGFLWQHPGQNRQRILNLCREKLGLDNDV